MLGPVRESAIDELNLVVKFALGELLSVGVGDRALHAAGEPDREPAIGEGFGELRMRVPKIA